TSLNYSDYKINLEEVYRHGIDVELGGHLTEKLSLYFSYAWQTFENQGDEKAGETELDERAENRLNVGARYALFEKTLLMLDYYYQSEEVTETYDEDTDYFNEVENDPYHLFDVGISQTLIESKGTLKDMILSFYIKNLFDESYYDSSGFPATDRTYGVSLSLNI
ncbi:MAG: TonB-dependent receptor, partial [Desulfobacteraceae bacterium]